VAKDNPYFKFHIIRWLTGDISEQGKSLKGSFVDLCAYYWSKDCSVSYSQASKKIGKSDLDKLVAADVVKLSGQKITILFLDEQLNERHLASKKNLVNGKKGGRPKNPLETHSVISGLPNLNPNERQGEREGEGKGEREETPHSLASEPKVIFRVGTAGVTVKYSEYMLNHHRTFVEARMMQNGQSTVQAAMQELDQKSIGKVYGDEGHLQNSLDSVVTRIKKENQSPTTGTFKPNTCWVRSS
jgi:hypothetical protein